MDSLTPPLVKICGLSDARTALAAVNHGATALGFMLAESRRKISPAAIAAILADLPPSRPPAVGVFVNESSNRINATMKSTGLDVVQLSGDETPVILDEIEHPAWKALRFAAGTSVDDACRAMEPWVSHRCPVEAILLDAAVAGSYGGTGHRADWELARRLADRFPVILAGGLNPTNVADAIEIVGPLGVDVSSGVEVEGRKDVERIEAFIKNSLNAFESQSKIWSRAQREL